METKKIEATVSAEKNDDLCNSTAMEALKYHHVHDNNRRVQYLFIQNAA